MIQLQDVTVCYEKHRRSAVPSLENLNLEIARGDWVFLVGPSGAGKSTLLKLLYAGVHPDVGQILVDGRDISHIAPRDVPILRRKIGIVFQDFQLLADKTAWENVAFALRVIGVSQDTIKRAVPHALETVGIAHRAHARPHELSGGEQQRVAIARAIVNDPLILLADEPTGNLDPDTAVQIGGLLRRISEERGTTIVMATHDRFLVDTMRRRVVRLKEGRLVSDENPGVYHPEDDGLPQLTPSLTVPNLPFTAFAASPSEAADPAIEDNPDQLSFEELTGTLDSELQNLDSPSGPEVPLASGEVPDSPPSDPSAATPSRPAHFAPADPRVVRALDSEAPIGSPENPIVQYDR